MYFTKEDFEFIIKKCGENKLKLKKDFSHFNLRDVLHDLRNVILCVEDNEDGYIDNEMKAIINLCALVLEYEDSRYIQHHKQIIDNDELFAKYKDVYTSREFNIEQLLENGFKKEDLVNKSDRELLKLVIENGLQYID